MLAVYCTGQFDYFHYIYSYEARAIHVYDNFYFIMQYQYSGLNPPVFVVYKEGNILNNPAVGLSISISYLHFYLRSVTESDIGVYEIKWVSGGLSWFTAFYVQGQNCRSVV